MCRNDYVPDLRINFTFIIIADVNFLNMGRGDKKTKKGKIAIGSFGNSRKKNAIKARLKKSASRKTAETAGAETPAKPKRTAKK
jgi:ribosomal small subunit protein bTHX